VAAWKEENHEVMEDSFFYLFSFLSKRSFGDYIRPSSSAARKKEEPELSANDPQAQRRGSEGSH
jgi:hypothetical protein